MSVKPRQRQDSTGTGFDMSPCIIQERNDIFKDAFSLNAKSGFPSLNQQISTQQSSSHRKMNTEMTKKKFFLAKRINPELLSEMANSPHPSQQILQAVTLNQLSQRKLSQANSPTTSKRNSVSFVPQQEKTREDQRLPSLINQGDSSPLGQQQNEVSIANNNNNTNALRVCISETIKTNNQDVILPDLNDKNLRKNQSTNNMPSASKKLNIFNQKSLNFEQKGPRYDELGNIISRSLAGKPDWYMKKDGQTIDQEKLKEISGNKKNSLLQKQNSFSTQSMKKSEAKSKHKWKHMSNKITKRQLLDQIDLIRDRIKNNTDNELNQINSMLIDQKIQNTRDMRIMNKHQENEIIWQKFIEKSSNDINRDLAYSMLIRQDQYRNMREATEVFNLCKSDLERYGPKLWEMTLRRHGAKKLNLDDELDKQEPADLIITTDLPYAFQRSSLAGERKNLEFIRKPIITDPVASIMNNTNDSKGFQNSHQRILNLKTMGETMFQNNISIITQNQLSMIAEQDHPIMLDSVMLNTSSNAQDLTQQQTDQIITDRQSQNNFSALNQSKFNSNMSNSYSQNMPNNTDGNDTRKHNKLTPMKTTGRSINKENGLGQLKQSQLQQKYNNLNQSGVSFMNSTFLTANQLQQPFQSFRASEYYNQRLNEVKDMIKDYKTIYEQNVDYQGLAVIGESQFEREIEMVKRANEYTLFHKQKQVETQEATEDLF